MESLTRQLRIDGSVDTPPSRPPLERNKNGSVPAKHIDAIAWFRKEHSLKLLATSAWPVYEFMSAGGVVESHDLADIVDAYMKSKDKSRKTGA
jgi:hypothetical protein